MKKIFILSLIAFTIISCKDTKKSQQNTAKKTQIPQQEIHKELYGFWVGGFFEAGAEDFEGDDYNYAEKLNIIIKRITKDTVIAQSIVSGNNRPLLGKLSEHDGKISFVLNEPGSHKYDGRFEFEIAGDSIIGKWNAFDANLKWPEKTYKLLKRKFVYNPEVMLPSEGDYVDWGDHKMVSQFDTLEDGTVDTLGINPFYRSASEEIFKLNASKALLAESNLKNLRKLDLQILKNTVFARHGYVFKKGTYRQFFDPVEWYVPVEDNVDNKLTAIENKNIKLLDRFIKYAEDNYDTFGR